MKIGLARIEDSEKNAIRLRNEAWLENGKEEKLKESLIGEMQAEFKTYNLDELEKFEAKKLLDLYRKLNSCRE